jgi:hypothetical protein
MSAHIEIPQKEVTAFCRRWRIVELAFFGSVLREDFHSDSDVDVLVSFQPEARHSLFDVLRMQKELGRLLGRDVDLIERRTVEKSRNYIRRGAILDSAEVFYAA